MIKSNTIPGEDNRLPLNNQANRGVTVLPPTRKRSLRHPRPKYGPEDAPDLIEQTKAVTAVLSNLCAQATSSDPSLLPQLEMTVMGAAIAMVKTALQKDDHSEGAICQEYGSVKDVAAIFGWSLSKAQRILPRYVADGLIHPFNPTDIEGRICDTQYNLNECRRVISRDAINTTRV